MNLTKLAAGIAALAAATAFLSWRDADRAKGGASAFVEGPLLEVADIERARRIVVREKPQSKTVQKDADGYEVRLIVDKDAPIREVVLEKVGDGWVVANQFQLEADANWMGQTLRDLAQGRLVRHIASEPALMQDLQLNLGEVRLEAEGGRVVRRLEFGRKDGGEVYQFVRINDANAYVVRHETEIVGDPLTWVAGRMLPPEVAEIQEVTLPFTADAHPPLRLVRAAKGAPLLPAASATANAEAAGQAAERILARLLAEPLVLAVDRNAAVAAAASQAPLATIKFTRFDGRVFTIRYGGVPKGHPGVDALAPYDHDSLVFAFFECSDPQQLAVRQAQKAALGYARATTVGRLPKDPAALIARPAQGETTAMAPAP